MTARYNSFGNCARPTVTQLMLFAFVAVLFSIINLVPTNAASETRRALVIGNSAYLQVGKLENPKNDAALMSSQLSKVGFEVTTLLDADLRQMRRTIEEFSTSLTTSNVVAAFYFAGHAVQIKGRNFLIPVDAKLETESNIEAELVSLNKLLQSLHSTQSRLNIVILDSCRNNPFRSIARSGVRGLSRTSAPRGTYIAYATAPGDVALDGAGGNSPYTRALAESLTEPGLTIEQVFKNTRRKVLKATNEQQVPWESSSIVGDFYFVRSNISTRPLPPRRLAPVPDAITTIPAPKEPQKADCFVFNGRRVCE